MSTLVGVVVVGAMKKGALPARNSHQRVAPPLLGHATLVDAPTMARAAAMASVKLGQRLPPAVAVEL
jgi:hypothetical protein